MSRGAVYSVLILAILVAGVAGYLSAYHTQTTPGNTLPATSTHATPPATSTLTANLKPEPVFEVKDGTPVLKFSPLIIRDIKVIRDGKVVAEYRKVGDPFTRVWQALVADWMFGLYYWNGGSDKIIAKTVTGGTDSWFDTESYGASKLTFYVSSNDTYATYNAYQLPDDKKTGVISVSKSMSTDTEYIWVITASYTHDEDTPYTVKAVYLTLTTGGNRQYLILADKVNPPVELKNGDTISVTWYIKFPRQAPLTDTFMGILSYFFGRTENSFSIVADFGLDYYSSDRVQETIYFEPVSASGEALGKVGVYKTIVKEDDAGVTVTLYAQYTSDKSVTVTHVNIYLVTDGQGSYRYKSWTYYKILSFDLSNPVSLDAGDVIIMKLTIQFPNQFTS